MQRGLRCLSWIVLVALPLVAALAWFGRCSPARLAAWRIRVVGEGGVVFSTTLLVGRGAPDACEPGREEFLEFLASHWVPERLRETARCDEEDYYALDFDAELVGDLDRIARRSGPGTRANCALFVALLLEWTRGREAEAMEILRTLQAWGEEVERVTGEPPWQAAYAKVHRLGRARNNAVFIAEVEPAIHWYRRTDRHRADPAYDAALNVCPIGSGDPYRGSRRCMITARALDGLANCYDEVYADRDKQLEYLHRVIREYPDTREALFACDSLLVVRGFPDMEPGEIWSYCEEVKALNEEWTREVRGPRLLSLMLDAPAGDPLIGRAREEIIQMLRAESEWSDWLAGMGLDPAVEGFETLVDWKAYWEDLHPDSAIFGNTREDRQRIRERMRSTLVGRSDWRDWLQGRGSAIAGADCETVMEWRREWARGNARSAPSPD